MIQSVWARMALFVCCGTLATDLLAADSEALAKQLANPVASLVSVPFQLNYDHNLGPDDEGERYTLNIQPVVPFSVGDDWNLISRTILPVMYQDDVVPNEGSQSGIGDVVQSVFLSPKEPTSGGWIWGVGPVFLLPTASDELLGTEQWGAGPTAVMLQQHGPWTNGVLVNHIWSYAGDNDRADVNSTFFQPFITYTTKQAVTFSFNTETTYDWEADEASIPVNFVASKVMKFGDQTVSLGAGLRYWVDTPDNGPEGFGVRLIMTFLFPK
ncbi:transporter [Pseudomaricurvus albidus]|uniref:transporter n=1 Tax=Pseudomaricurvus albidus TaxID=2842452 RepID=UPI001F420580|nr:transporter [Aestuariicella albida]